MAEVAVLINGGYTLIYQVKSSGTFSFVAKDYFKGQPYSATYILIGGGGGGGAVLFGSINDSSYDTAYVLGGGSGQIRSGTITLTPGATYSGVIGSGGNGVLLERTTNEVGTNGGSSSFNGVTANGGGIGSEASSTSKTSAGYPGADFKNSSEPAYSKFETDVSTSIYSSAGGCLAAQSKNDSHPAAWIDQKSITLGNYKTSAARFNPAPTTTNIASSGSLPGCGGGAAAVAYISGTYNSPMYARGANGAPGALFIYAKGIQVG